MSLLRTLACLVFIATPAFAQPPRSAAIGVKADYHVHAKADLTLDEALRRSRESGIYYGIVINGGADGKKAVQRKPLAR